jgi:Na+/alanine symporter
MSAQQSDSEPREAGIISLIPSVMTLFIAIFITSFIASYGIDAGIIKYTADSDAVYRLSSFFNTASSVTGTFGLIVMSLFTVLSAMTTILGSYYYLRKLFKNNAANKNIAIYMTLVIVAGTLAIFGANVVFEAVDLLLFVCCGINLIALTIFAYKTNKEIKAGKIEEVKEVA